MNPKNFQDRSKLHLSQKLSLGISHRGIVGGTAEGFENHPDRISEVAKNFKVEVDVWLTPEGYFLGHDSPQYKVDKLFLFDERFLVHCKNLEAFEALYKHGQVEVFLQESDSVSLTSHKNLVFHEHQKETAKRLDTGYAVDINLSNSWESVSKLKGVVTDFPEKLLEIQSEIPKKLIPDLLICDIDGVMTSGRKLYDLQGQVLAKEYSDHDFTAIKRFRNAGIDVVLLSGDENINRAMAAKRGIPFYFARNASGNIDKSEFLESLKAEYNAEYVAYVGDDYYDITIMEQVDWSFAPASSSPDVRRIASHTLESAGGQGAIAEIFDYFAPEICKKFAFDEPLK